MNSPSVMIPLSSMETCWTTVGQAHAGPDDAARSARGALLERYHGAVYRYLLGAVRDPDVAGELAQEFALRVLRGDLRRADRERGRFRDYLRAVLSNLVNKHFQTRQRLPRTVGEETWAALNPSAPGAAAPTLEECLREEILARTWRQLKQSQPRYHTVLLLRVEQPELSSTEMAERLTAITGAPWTAGQARKVLERARVTFLGLLLEEVASSLQCPRAEDLCEALQELDLLKYCRTALERRSLGARDLSAALAVFRAGQRQAIAG